MKRCLGGNHFTLLTATSNFTSCNVGYETSGCRRTSTPSLVEASLLSPSALSVPRSSRSSPQRPRRPFFTGMSLMATRFASDDTLASRRTGSFWTPSFQGPWTLMPPSARYLP